MDLYEERESKEEDLVNNLSRISFLPKQPSDGGHEGDGHEGGVEEAPREDEDMGFRKVQRRFSHGHGIDADCQFRLGSTLVHLSTLGKYGELRANVNTTGIPDTVKLRRLVANTEPLPPLASISSPKLHRTPSSTPRSQTSHKCS